MGHDHKGQRVSRRVLIAGIGSLGLGGLVTASGPRAGAADSLFAGPDTCRLTPSATKGPFYFDSDKIRSDIREDRLGVRLRLAIKVQDSETCKPMPGAVVEIWHCDAAGLYSGAEAASKGGLLLGKLPTADTAGKLDMADIADMKPTDAERYLRGAQVTDSDGVVMFTTIWPGWYPGRTVHIHVMVHLGDERVLSTQLMFDDTINAKVLATPPYQRLGTRDTFNAGDPDYREGMLVRVAEDDGGYLGTVVLSADSDRDRT
ncbi:intradiol ring-cleavage dioxygenase [Nonomuraea sp. NPDC046802]|uniref:intradiol ring-cleavage dioxygenase n=1 Tax=Nonomuraea sp. NPDC046802 TaxID=3154919 RepID=UPI003404EAAD